MNISTDESMARAAAEAIREWPQRVVEAGVKASDGRAYRPVPRNVEILRYVDEPSKLIAYAKEQLNRPVDEFEQGPEGWERVVRQVGVEFTWEWVLVDPEAEWAPLFTNAERQRVIATARVMGSTPPKDSKSTRDRVQQIADTVALDENGTPVLNVEVRFYKGGHLFLRGYGEDGTVASAIGCRDLAEAVVLTGDAVRRARAKAMRLLMFGTPRRQRV